MTLAKRITVIVLSLALFAAPFAAVFALAQNARGVYQNTFTAELPYKYDLLYATKDRKTVVVGGSSVCFGLDSALLSEMTGRKVVDFGLYATLGTKVMLDLSKRAIGQGDTVILAPELDAQTMSLYFNQNAVLEAFDGRYDMMRDVGGDNIGDIAGAFLTYISKATNFRREGIFPNPSGVYNRSSFNEYGDIAYPRTANVMALGYDANRPVDLSADIISDDFIDYLNGYIDDCSERGADVWFSFCPINRSGLKAGTTDGSIYEFYRYLSEKLHCRVISDINDYILDREFFYDTNFHLNDIGVRIRTQTLARDILRAEGDNRAVLIDYPDEPADTTPEPTPVNIDKPDETFVFTSFGKGLAVTGVLDPAKTSSSLDIPREFDGIPVYAILADAFEGCDVLTSVTIHPNIVFIADNAFNIPSLKSLFIDARDSGSMEAGDNIFGENSGAEIYLPDTESYENFVTGYWWSLYGGRMKIAKG